VVLIAGGDGTVSRAACELSGWQVPLSVVPLGTANNTALTLKVPERAKKLTKRLELTERIPFDLGTLSDGAVRRRFAEAVGWGVFPETVACAKRAKNKRLGSKRSAEQTLRHDRKLFRAAVQRAQKRFYGIEIDGRDVSGEYIMVEVMNVPLLGPRLLLSERSVPGDGQFELLLVGEAERHLLDELAANGVMSQPLRSEQGLHIRIEASEGLLHRDGRVVRHARGPRRFEIDVEPQAVSYLR
jgi:diacylglycerol kinase family enzyme